MATSPSRLLALADHLKLSLLERQRAIALDLEPNSQDAEISRSLNTLQDGLESLEASSDPSPDTQRLRQQFNDLYSQFTGHEPPTPISKEPNDPALASDFSRAQQLPPARPTSTKRPTRLNSSTKSVRFTDNPADAAAAAADPATDAQDAANRAALFPYRDDPDDSAPLDQSQLDNQQIHAYHSRVIREQDEQLGVLGQSIGRQRELSIQIGGELDEQNQMLEDVDEHVMRHQTQIDKARGRLGTIARKAKDNMQLTIIFILIIILVLLIIILK